MVCHPLGNLSGSQATGVCDNSYSDCLTKVFCVQWRISFIFPEAASPNKPPYLPLAVAFAEPTAPRHIYEIAKKTLGHSSNTPWTR